MASFMDGLNVTTSLRKRSSRKKRSKSKLQEEECALSRSLQHSPRIIGEEYEKGCRYAGPRFAQGDGLASSRLNEILLRLNTGLVNIIASFLNTRSHDEPRLDYAALTELSEASRQESLSVLHQLYQRLMSSRLPAAVSRGKQKSTRPRAAESRLDRASATSTKIRRPTIAQVTIEDSSKRPQLAMVKPSPISKRRLDHSSQPRLPTSPTASSSTTLVNSPSQLSLHSHGNDRARSPHQTSPLPRLKKQSSAAIIPAQRKTTPAGAKSQPNLLRSYRSGDPQHTTTQPRRTLRINQANGSRQTSPTLYSIATDSTKLGEIPTHRWAVPYDFDATSLLNRDALQNGWPIRDINGEFLVKPKKRFGWFGLGRQMATA